MEVPTLNVVGDVYQFAWPLSGVEMTLDRIGEGREGIQAEITVGRSLGATPGLLHYARLNLLSTTTRASLGKALAARADDVDWGAALEQVCLMAVARYRTGDPVIDLREVDLTGATRWRVRPFIEEAAATVIFADGGTGKSTFALAIAVTQATGVPVLGTLIGEPGPVLYLDWEADEVTHAERLQAIHKGSALKVAPPIYYRRMVASLKEAAPFVRKDIAQLGIKLVIVDSLGAAKGGEPEGADASLALFGAARSFCVPWLGIDHITKAATSPTSGKGRPFGSTYTHNLARLTWSLEQAEEQHDDGFALALTNHKRNNGRLLPRQGYRVHMEVLPDTDQLLCVRYEAIEMKADPGLAEKLPLKDRLLITLQRGAVTLADLYAAHPNDAQDQIRARLNNLSNDHKVIKLDAHRWGLSG